MAEGPGWAGGLGRPRGAETRRVRGNRRPRERSWRHGPRTGRLGRVSGRRLGKVAPERLASGAGGAARAKAPAVSDVTGVGAPDLAWSPAAGMWEGLTRHFPACWRETYAPACRPCPGTWAGPARGYARICASRSPPTAGSRPSTVTGRSPRRPPPCRARLRPRGAPPPAAQPHMRVLGRRRRGAARPPRAPLRLK